MEWEEKSRAGQGLYEDLGRLDMYRLRQNSLIDSELLAYDTAFWVLEQLLAEIENQAFVQTAEGQALIDHEMLVGLGERRHVSLENRRHLVIYRRSLAAYDFSPEGIVRSLRAAGLEAELIENSLQEAVVIRSHLLIDDFEDLDSLKARISAMLPAHLDWEFDTGVLTWDMLEELLDSWDRWDGLAVTWDMFDIDGHNILA